jgi:hypothetical protein
MISSPDSDSDASSCDSSSDDGTNDATSTDTSASDANGSGSPAAAEAQQPDTPTMAAGDPAQDRTILPPAPTMSAYCGPGAPLLSSRLFDIVRLQLVTWPWAAQVVMARMLALDARVSSEHADLQDAIRKASESNVAATEEAVQLPPSAAGARGAAKAGKGSRKSGSGAVSPQVAFQSEFEVMSEALCAKTGTTKARQQQVDQALSAMEKLPGLSQACVQEQLQLAGRVNALLSEQLQLVCTAEGGGEAAPPGACLLGLLCLLHACHQLMVQAQQQEAQQQQQEVQQQEAQQQDQQQGHQLQQEGQQQPHQRQQDKQAAQAARRRQRRDAFQLAQACSMQSAAKSLLALLSYTHMTFRGIPNNLGFNLEQLKSAQRRLATLLAAGEPLNAGRRQRVAQLQEQLQAAEQELAAQCRRAMGLAAAGSMPGGAACVAAALEWMDRWRSALPADLPAFAADMSDEGIQELLWIGARQGAAAQCEGSGEAEQHRAGYTRYVLDPLFKRLASPQALQLLQLAAASAQEYCESEEAAKYAGNAMSDAVQGAGGGVVGGSAGGSRAPGRFPACTISLLSLLEEVVLEGAALGSVATVAEAHRVVAAAQRAQAQLAVQVVRACMQANGASVDC